VKAWVIYGVSLAVHASLAVSVASLKPRPRARPATSIAVREVKRKAAAPEPPPPPPPPPPTPKAPAPRKAPVARPTPAAPPPSAAPASAPRGAVPDFGLALGGGVGAGGLAVPAPREAAEREPAKPKLSEARPAAGGCDEEPVKPKPRNIVQPVYASEEARTAGIEGKVRVEITVAEDGTVKNARLVQGLGYGLDEAALDAARASTFEPGTRCGKPTETTFVLGIRFSL
jgi:protein TonB